MHYAKQSHDTMYIRREALLIIQTRTTIILLCTCSFNSLEIVWSYLKINANYCSSKVLLTTDFPDWIKYHPDAQKPMQRIQSMKS